MSIGHIPARHLQLPQIFVVGGAQPALQIERGFTWPSRPVWNALQTYTSN